MPRDTPGWTFGPCTQCPHSGRLKDGVCRICRATARDARRRQQNTAAGKRSRQRRARARAYGVCAGVGEDRCTIQSQVLPTPTVQGNMLTLKEALTVNAVRDRLRGALRSGDVYAVREEVINVLAEIGSGTIMPAVVDQEADTMRCPYGPDFEPDSAPSVPVERPTGGP